VKTNGTVYLSRSRLRVIYAPGNVCLLQSLLYLLSIDLSTTDHAYHARFVTIIHVKSKHTSTILWNKNGDLNRSWIFLFNEQYVSFLLNVNIISLPTRFLFNVSISIDRTKSGGWWRVDELRSNKGACIWLLYHWLFLCWDSRYAYILKGNE
jgi:hypothetical protein